MNSGELWTVRNLTRGTVVASCAERTASSAERRRGLLGRAGLPDGGGLFIAPCESVHSFGMQFVIDVVYVGKDWVVRKVRRQMKPGRISFCLQASGVLELPAGGADGVQTGDLLQMVRSA